MRLLLWPLAALAVLSMAACETPPPPYEFAEITFLNRDRIKLDVAEIVVDNLYGSPRKDGFVEHEFPINPGATAARWAKDRLEAVGTDGRLTVSIIEASVQETALEMKSGLEGLMTTEQSERYDGLIVLTLEAENVSRRISATARGEVRRSQTVPEDITLAGRERVWYEMTEQMMADLDRVMTKNVNTHLVDFIVR